MTRKSDPRTALDYPNLDDSLWVFWSGNEYNWPHAKRTLSYLSGSKTHITKGFALYTTDSDDAKTFDDPESAVTWLREQESVRFGGREYGYRGEPGAEKRGFHLYLTTVAELKRVKGYAATDS